MEEKNNKKENEEKTVKDNVEDFTKRQEQKLSEEEEKALRDLQEEIDKLGTKDIVMQMMMSLSSLAYKKMGLPVGTNDKYKDKSQAKLAVDCFESLLKALSDEASASELEMLKSSLSNLQLNFVKVFS